MNKLNTNYKMINRDYLRFKYTEPILKKYVDYDNNVELILSEIIFPRIN